MRLRGRRQPGPSWKRLRGWGLKRRVRQVQIVEKRPMGSNHDNHDHIQTNRNNQLSDLSYISLTRSRKERSRRKCCVKRGPLTSVIAFFFPFNPIVLPAFLAAIPPAGVGLAVDPADAVAVADDADEDEDEGDEPGRGRVERPIDSCSISK